MGRTARLASLLFLLVAGLVVMSLPGTTSASPAPAPPRAPAPAPVAPLLIDLFANVPAETAAPPPAASYFGRAQVVSVYGFPGVCVMGELGCREADDAAAFAQDLARRYDETNGERDVIAALHLIVAVAQADPGVDGTYLGRMPLETIEQYVAAARRHGLLLFLDVQVGWADPVTEVRRLSPVLAEPFVHLALDPEFATRAKGEAPGAAIGTLDATQVNAVQDVLVDVVRAYTLPPKALVLHQFKPYMLTDKEAYADHAEVDLTIDMDGFGSPEAKLSGYDAYARVGARYSALKLFFHWDVPVMMPETLNALPYPPDYVIYQ